jgi:predicted carbohydrate-binding protein with CBM5 and CBM33 domain
MHIRSLVVSALLAVGVLVGTALPAAAHGLMVDPSSSQQDCMEKSTSSNVRDGIIQAGSRNDIVAWDHCD